MLLPLLQQAACSGSSSREMTQRIPWMVAGQLLQANLSMMPLLVQQSSPRIWTWTWIRP